MMSRVRGKSAKKDKRNYYNRGVGVDPRWLDFRNFFADMGTRPDGHTIDRIDTNKGYSKDNCRWATPLTQARNHRKNRNNTSGVNGVCRRRKMWQANIYIEKRLTALGCFATIEEAAAARRAAEEKYWGDER